MRGVSWVRQEGDGDGTESSWNKMWPKYLLHFGPATGYRDGGSLLMSECQSQGSRSVTIFTENGE